MKRKQVDYDVLLRGKVFQVRRYRPKSLLKVGVESARFLAAAPCLRSTAKKRVRQLLLMGLKHTAWVPDGEPFFLSRELLLPVRCAPVRFGALNG